MPHVRVKDLPSQLRGALESLGYARADVSLDPRETYSMSAGGSGDGRRAFVCAVNLQTGEREIARGSWGGPNMFNPRNAVDLDQTDRPLPINFAVIHGSEGNTVYASIYVNPATLTPMLPAAPQLGDFERSILNVIGGYTSAGRKNEWERLCSDAGRKAGDASGLHYSDRARWGIEGEASKAKQTEIDGAIDTLVSLGLCKRNKAGAVSITTEGKNARGSRY